MPAAAIAANESRPVQTARDLCRDGDPRVPSIIASSHKNVEIRNRSSDRSCLHTTGVRDDEIL
jgi:hypothetical protein